MDSSEKVTFCKVMSISKRNTLGQHQQAKATVVRPVPRDKAQLCLGGMSSLKWLAHDPSPPEPPGTHPFLCSGSCVIWLWPSGSTEFPIWESCVQMHKVGFLWPIYLFSVYFIDSIKKPFKKRHREFSLMTERSLFIQWLHLYLFIFYLFFSHILYQDLSFPSLRCSRKFLQSHLALWSCSRL